MRAGPGRAALARRRRGRPSSRRSRRSPPPPPPSPPRFLLLLLRLLPLHPAAASSVPVSAAAPGPSATAPRESAPRPGAPRTKAGGPWGRTRGRAVEAGAGEPAWGAVGPEERGAGARGGRSGPRDPLMGFHSSEGAGRARRGRWRASLAGGCETPA
ncbi:uncharacterized protein [Tursiops truncatus]|uniref:Translation initiation factor IF-2-like n=1 Tax=Tursiops truncatus TaxID=9739 RepID=A0A6J3RD43_TURTR|nr:translation initiation factor IF-2-like [Tursiops truncatus]